jgi:hypothetical protein
VPIHLTSFGILSLTVHSTTGLAASAMASFGTSLASISTGVALSVGSSLVAEAMAHYGTVLGSTAGLGLAVPGYASAMSSYAQYFSDYMRIFGNAGISNPAYVSTLADNVNLLHPIDYSPLQGLLNKAPLAASNGGISTTYSPTYVLGGIALAGTSEISVPALLIGGAVIGTVALMSGSWNQGEYDPTLDNYLNGFRNMDKLNPVPPGDPGKWPSAVKWAVGTVAGMKLVKTINDYFSELNKPVVTQQPQSPEIHPKR